VNPGPAWAVHAGYSGYVLLGANIACKIRQQRECARTSDESVNDHLGEVIFVFAGRSGGGQQTDIGSFAFLLPPIMGET
jgi:hypothetical protein